MNSFKAVLFVTALFSLLAVVIIGCSTPAATPTNAPPTVAPATAAPAATNTGALNPTTTSATTNAGETVTLVVVPEKSEVRYRVREQLAGFDLPNDAIGRTKAITGQIVGKRSDGSIDSANSKFVVDVRTLRSDQGARDNFIQRTPLQSSQYPNVTFVPTSAPGLPLLVPDSGSATFQLMGDLTIRDVTKPVTWQASCQLESNQTEGKCTATTSFIFADFSLEQPRVARVLSIDDKITLEVDLYLQRVNP